MCCSPQNIVRALSEACVQRAVSHYFSTPYLTHCLGNIRFPNESIHHETRHDLAIQITSAPLLSGPTPKILKRSDPSPKRPPPPPPESGRSHAQRLAREVSHQEAPENMHDLAQQNFVTDASILDILEARFKRDKIYVSSLYLSKDAQPEREKWPNEPPHPCCHCCPSGSYHRGQPRSPAQTQKYLMLRMH